MRHRLEKVVNLTSKVIETLKEGKVYPNCPTRPEDCEAISRCGSRNSGVYTVWPWNRILTSSIQVYCDMETDGGAWTVIQRRGNFGRSKDYFYNNWNAYKEGFGDISQDFWIGNDLLFTFTNQKLYSLRFDLRDLEGESRWAMYDKFWVNSEEYNYTLSVQGYTGTAGDSFSGQKRMQFSTKDRDNDMSTDNCAMKYKGAWWYGKCHSSNLNGFYLNGTHSSFADGIEWKPWRGYNYSLPFTEMKIRPIFFKPDKGEIDTVIPL